MIKTKKINLRYVTNEKGKKTEVILKVKDFEEILEDLNDLAVIAERKNEKVIPHSEVLKELKKNGAI